MKSFNRLKQLNFVVCDLIEKEQLNEITVADIAADHGYLSELISRNANVKKVIATDISEKCLDKTNELISANNLTKIETRLGNGLNAIEGADIAVIAGIGGYEIIKMLSTQNQCDKAKKVRYFVLQPSKNPVQLREWIYGNKLLIIKDFIVQSCNRFYPIIIVDCDRLYNKKPTFYDLYFGKDNDEKNIDFIEYLKFILSELNFLENINKNSIENDNDLITKNKIYQMAKNIIIKAKGE